MSLGSGPNYLQAWVCMFTQMTTSSGLLERSLCPDLSSSLRDNDKAISFSSPTLHFCSSPEESGKWFHQHSVISQPNERRPSLGFDATTAKELAEIMSALDYKLFRRIPVSLLTLPYSWK